MTKHSQQGSAHVVAIICLVLALVTALGWVFYQNFIYREPTKTDTELLTVEKKDNKKQVEETTEPKDATADWYLYASKSGYSVRLPDGWRLLNEIGPGGNDRDGGWLVSRGYNGETPNPFGGGKTTSVSLKSGVKAIVQDVRGPGECYNCRFMLVQDDQGAKELTDHYKEWGATKRASSKTKQGNVVERYEEIAKDDGSGITVKGTKTYSYRVHANTGTRDVRITYAFQPGEKDVVKTVDLLVESVEFTK
ncbi:MAG TPA: hypothetical protein VGE34_01770 [Candidatus Saccharimonadales bacterium]